MLVYRRAVRRFVDRFGERQINRLTVVECLEWAKRARTFELQVTLIMLRAAQCEGLVEENRWRRRSST